MREYIIMIASIVTALTVISTTCFKVYIFFRNLEKKYDEMNDILKNNITVSLLYKIYNIFFSASVLGPYNPFTVILVLY